MEIGGKYTVTVDKLSNLGLGISKLDGMVVFIENACPGDKLLVKITNVKKNYANAEISEIIEPSPHRVKPFCPLQKVCGSCQLQFIDYDYQLELKREIVKDAMHTIGNFDIDIPMPIASPQIKEYRCKVQYPVSQTKVSQRLVAGYYKKKSHEIINIKYCPVQPEICDDIINFIRENATNFKISGYNEKSRTGILKHIVLRYSAYTGKCLVVLVINSDKELTNVDKFAKKIFDNFEEISGVSVNYNPLKNNLIMTDNTKSVIGNNFIEEKIDDKIFSFGTNSFFQINPKSAENIFLYVKNYIKENFNSPTLFDAYAGVTAFGIVLSDICKRVVSVEECKDAVDWAKITLQNNNISNVELHNSDAEKFFAGETRKFDITILDPPRKGSTEKTLDNVLKLTNEKIIYISCNPATLARDLKYLVSKGAVIESIQPFDMFCHTYHIENAAIIDLKEVNK